MTKPGRNDPCPCGSGKKYKQCCLLKDQKPAKRKFKAKVLSQPNPAEAMQRSYSDLMQRTYGESLTGDEQPPKPPT